MIEKRIKGIKGSDYARQSNGMISPWKELLSDESLMAADAPASEL
ncbi:hypothetical protein [Neomoorella thermoacetica]|uniref:Uncharacterized protein n=1 Tax=Moorella thermoacetica Y72 TaxID=1325331 RepID=A0A0S6UGK0_NEOTH|nr:hypothetical protein [Moorella thermoacetica]APC07984.1 hypothetical protein MTJW_08140 [Moorella thermoacetica]OIQ11227.1 hypothetical protein MOOTH_18000 [Moorella thermoacetica]GAF26582.1 hypothetical protein MTY_1922 [Moorella thermoacetica Y72]